MLRAHQFASQAIICIQNITFVIVYVKIISHWAIFDAYTGTTQRFGGESLPLASGGKLVFRYPFEAGRPRNAPRLLGGPQWPFAYEPVKDVRAAGAVAPHVALLDRLFTSGMFLPCPERGKEPFPG